MYECPKCGSEQTQTFKLAYLSGCSTSESVIDGFTTDLDGVIGYQRGRKTSEIARLLAPPQRKKIPAIVSLICFFAFPLLFVLRHIERGYEKWNKEEFPKLYEGWENSWLCHRCGCTFTVTQPRTVERTARA